MVVEGYLEGFLGFWKKEGIEIETMRLDMDTVRNEKEEWKLEQAELAKQMIDKWQPDLIFATDDTAQEYVIESYYLNSDIPVVFTGVNREPEVYNYDKAKNVAGVLEREFVDESLELLQQLFPYVKKLVVFAEPTKQWDGVMERISERSKTFGMEVIAIEKQEFYEDFQNKVLYYQDKTDAFVFTPLSRFVDRRGNNVGNKIFGKWIAENSNLPDLGLWVTVITTGQTCGVMISNQGMGADAAELGYEILIKGKRPSSFKFKPTDKKVPMINLARLKKLDIEKEDISSTILINSMVIEEYPWDE